MKDSPKGFDVLKEMPKIPAAELARSLDDYARSGASIYVPVVVDLLDRAELTRADLETLLASAELGVQAHEQRAEGKRFNGVVGEVRPRVDLLSRIDFGAAVLKGEKAKEGREQDEYKTVADEVRRRLAMAAA